MVTQPMSLLRHSRAGQPPLPSLDAFAQLQKNHATDFNVSSLESSSILYPHHYLTLVIPLKTLIIEIN